MSNEAAPDSEKPPNSKISYEERFELAAKLENELDEFISGLEEKTYTDGWNEDTWQEVCSGCFCLSELDLSDFLILMQNFNVPF